MMKRIYLFALTSFLFVVLATSFAIHTQAASNLQVSLYSARGYQVTGSADTNDDNNMDNICVICRNADGTLNDVDILPFSVGSQINARGGCDSRFPTSSTPFSVAVYDPSGPFTGNEDTAAGAAYCESPSGPPEPPTVPQGPSADAESVALPSCIDTMPIPDSAVGGKFISDAVIHWMPSSDGATEYVITAGNTARVIGLDESGVYAKIIWVCGTYWVEANTLVPNDGYPWNGAPLPTDIVD